MSTINCQKLYHGKLMQMSNKLNQLQNIHIEQVAEMLHHYLFCSYLFVQRVAKIWLYNA